MSTPAHWSRLAERGSGFGLRFVFVCQRLLGRRATRILLYPIVLYFFMTAKAARKASMDYLQQLQDTRLPGLPVNRSTVFRHLYAFAASGLDKLVAWSGRLDHASVAFPQRAAFESLLASGRGAILVGAHLGNLEMTRALARGSRVTNINAVVYTDHAQRFSRILEHANADFGADLIQVSSLGPDTAIILKEKIDKGELLVIVGDRTPPSDNGRVVEAMFLGRQAPFALGPWILASLLECPVVPVLLPSRRRRLYAAFRALCRAHRSAAQTTSACAGNVRATLCRPPCRLLHHGTTTMVQFF